jgi:hypothetical protein
MSCYAGKDGALSVDGTNVAMLTSWTVTQNAEVLECAYMGASWKDHKAGLKSWEGSAEANFTDTVGAGSNQAANEIGVGSVVTLYFYPDAADVDFGFTGSAVVTSIENGAALGEVQTVSLSFTGHGALTTDVDPAP